MCENCQRYSDQRDAALRRTQAAIEHELWAQARLAQAMFDIETLEGDRELLMGQNAELRARAEHAERQLCRLRRKGKSHA
jgi:hypothetical protein